MSLTRWAVRRIWLVLQRSAMTVESLREGQFKVFEQNATGERTIQENWHEMKKAEGKISIERPQKE
jgi:hypothetical protein